MEDIVYNVWIDDLIWCPSQCYYYFKHNNSIYCIYLRWRHSDPWTAELLKWSEDLIIQHPERIDKVDADWEDIKVNFYSDEQLEDLKEEVIKIINHKFNINLINQNKDNENGK